MNQVATISAPVQSGMDLTQEKLDLIRRTVCAGCNQEEFSIFIHACKRTGLDPLMRQIYAVKYGSQMTIQTGIDGFRLIAERTGCYSPGKEPTYNYDANGNLISATSHVKKMTGDKTWHEVSATAFYQEYCKIERNGQPGKFWKQMPHGQLAKCAEALALRKAFPGDFSAIYVKEEMEQASNGQTIDVTPVGEPTPIKLISEDQAKELVGLLAKCADADKERVWAYLTDGLKIMDLSELDVSRFDAIHKRVTALAQKNAEVVDAVA